MRQIIEERCSESSVVCRLKWYKDEQKSEDKTENNGDFQAEVNEVLREKRFVGVAAAIGGWKSRTSKIKTRGVIDIDPPTFLEQRRKRNQQKLESGIQ